MSSVPVTNDLRDQELARLRLKVEELEAKLQRSSSEALEHPLAALSLGLAAATGPRFFEVLVAELARVLDCHTAIVGIVEGEHCTHVRTLAYFHRGEQQEATRYELIHTPCENVVRSDFCYYPSNVQEDFPRDAFLKTINGHSYAGMPIRDRAGHAIGLISVLGESPFGDRAVVEATLRITASRAAAELERDAAEHARDRTESELRRQLAEVSAIYQSAPIGLAFIDRNLNFLSINDMLARYGNRDAQEYRGRSIREMLPLIASEVETKIRYVVKTGEAILDSEVTGPIYPGDPADRVRLRTFFPVKDPAGQLLGVSVIIQDVTESKRIENLLRRREEELRQKYAELSTIYRTAPIGLAYIDTQLRYRAISEELAKINGLPVSAHYGRTLAELIPELAKTELPTMQRVLDTGVPVVEEEVSAQTPAHPGQTREYRRSLIPVQSEDGRRLGLNIVVQDVTEQKRTEAALRIYDHAMRSAVGGIVLGDMSGNITWVNPACERILGYSAKELVGTNGDQVVTDFAYLDYQRKKFLEQGTMSAEFKTRRKDGQIIDVLVHSSIVHDSNGQPICSMSWCEDVTQKKRYEAEREALIAQLEAKNAELERFTYTVSHDLKSPLVTISGFVGMLDHDLSTGNAAAVRDDLNEISAAAVRMKRLLDELLQLSRIGRVINPPQLVSLTALAEQAKQALSTGSVRVEIDPELPAVRCDAIRLVEVFQNLLDNAVRFSQGQPNSVVRVGCRTDGDRRVVFVRDNGVGIEPQYLQRIFNLFEQLDPRMGGTGLGLAITKRIIEVHGGAIWAESEGLGKGATFCFTLPEAVGAELSGG